MIKVALVVLNLTEDVFIKLAPVMMTEVPTDPLAGLKEEIVGTGAFTIRVVVTGLMVIPEAVALIVRVLDPVTVFVVVLMVSTELFPVVGSGLKEAVAPLGNPLIDKSTFPEKSVRLIERVYVPLAPAMRVLLAGVMDKFTDGLVTVKLLLLVAVPPAVVTRTNPVLAALGTVAVI